ncbi:hypothetical protein [Streptomyces sp. NBC_01438]|uniref:hypothetical protein n=1 Tax=Streptomyces sp. NBC_01438 TaxID=2903866 RepID=UPI00352F2D1A
MPSGPLRQAGRRGHDHARTGLPDTATAAQWPVAWADLDALEAVGLITTEVLTGPKTEAGQSSDRSLASTLARMTTDWTAEARRGGRRSDELTCSPSARDACPASRAVRSRDLRSGGGAGHRVPGPIPGVLAPAEHSAGRLYDYHGAHPHLLRLLSWEGLRDGRARRSSPRRNAPPTTPTRPHRSPPSSSTAPSPPTSNRAGCSGPPSPSRPGGSPCPSSPAWP